MKPLIKVSIPPDWTGAQANAVLDLLDDIVTAIWDAHEEKILEDQQQQDAMLERAARGDVEDDPFDDDFPL
jgi:hypothetical protein